MAELFAPPPLERADLSRAPSGLRVPGGWPVALLPDVERVLSPSGAVTWLEPCAGALDPAWPSVVAAAPREHWGAWLAKLQRETAAGRLRAGLLLLRAATDADWFARLAPLPRCYLRGRLHFPGFAREAPSAHLLTCAGSDGAALERFRTVFGSYGVLEGGREPVPPPAPDPKCDEISSRAPSRASRWWIGTWARGFFATLRRR